MALQATYPGVYVNEVPSGVRTITGVSTSIALFIGYSTKGPINKPVRCLNYTAFKNAFGEDTSASRLSQYVQLFFVNGGTDCYVVRIASGATTSELTLRSATPADVLRLVAVDAGVSGDEIRAVVTYNGAQPEMTFNLELFRLQKDVRGNLTKTNQEYWEGLTFNPNGPRYVQTYITQKSKLVAAFDVSGGAAAKGTSMSGRNMREGAGGYVAATWKALLGPASTTGTFQIKIGSNPFVNVNINGVDTSTKVKLLAAIVARIQAAYAAISLAVVPGVDLEKGDRLIISAPNNGEDVLIVPGLPDAGKTDVAGALMLGTNQGGIEIGAYASLRPAPSGISVFAGEVANLAELDKMLQEDVTNITLEEINELGVAVIPAPAQKLKLNLVTSAIGKPFYESASSPVNGNFDGIREKLQKIAVAINNATASAPSSKFPWRAEVWQYRLAILPKESLKASLNESQNDDFTSGGVGFVGGTFATAAAGFIKNSHYYRLGGFGASAFQNLGLSGTDGGIPTAADYSNAYVKIDKDVDLFNLLVLPPIPGVAVDPFYANASIYCQSRRAMLLMDPPESWSDAMSATTGIGGVRIGLVKDYSALFFPQIKIREGELEKTIGPSAAIAGLCARTDATRGVWKAPAGIEADLRGIIGVKEIFTDAENGILNPRAINTIRVFPSGIVNWGARTNMGDDDTPHDYKYIPVRRTALFIEESLYRGLKWVVFEPNDEPLWAQIRLNVGAFMNNLFRQGAFKGVKSEAYYVKCDAETTTQNDINLGIVNVWVGFAPLKPAEFVMIYLQQIAGKIEV